MHGLVTGQDPRQRRGDLELKLENPLGFFESQRLVETNDALLEAQGCRWDLPPLLPARWDQSPLLDSLQPLRSRLSTYALEHAWVDKDPRLCITFPAYLHILLRRIPLVVALREPMAVAASLYARNGFSLNHGLVLWWIYNHHIASQLCLTDLLITYGDLLTLDCTSIQQLFGPFLEVHKYQRPSDDQARALLTSFLKPEFNRAQHALNAECRLHVNPLLLRNCNLAYEGILNASNKLASFQEHFDSLPRVLLESSAREQLLPEAKTIVLSNRLKNTESELEKASFSLKQRERDCDRLQYQLRGLQTSRSWRITAPLRMLMSFLKAKDV